MKAPAIKDLLGLKAVKAELEARVKLAKELEATRKAALAKAKAEEEFFARAVGIVKPLPPKHRPGERAALPLVQAAPVAVQHQLDAVPLEQREQLRRIAAARGGRHLGEMRVQRGQLRSVAGCDLGEVLGARQLAVSVLRRPSSDRGKNKSERMRL